VPNEDIYAPTNKRRDPRNGNRKITTHPTPIPTLISINNHNRNDDHPLLKLDSSSHNPIILGWIYVPSGNTPIVSPRWRARDVVSNGLEVDLKGEWS
jgi:hypothetical protein